MLGTIRHRGPDQFGILLNPIAALGSARLSIIDLSDGRQPISNEDQSLWIVYNGEVFNYIELRQDLEQRGHVFKTHSDTEVVVHAYEEYGPECLSRRTADEPRLGLALQRAASSSDPRSRKRIVH